MIWSNSQNPIKFPLNNWAQCVKRQETGWTILKKYFQNCNSVIIYLPSSNSKSIRMTFKYFVNKYTYKRVQWLFLAQFCQSGEKCWADVPAQVIFGSISHRNRFNHCWNRWQRQKLCFHILFTELIWTRLDLLTVGKHEPDLPLSSREGFTAMHSIPQVTRAESRSQTDGDIHSDDVCPEEYFPERGKKYDCYIYYSMHNEYSFVAMTIELCDWFRHCNEHWFCKLLSWSA